MERLIQLAERFDRSSLLAALQSTEDCVKLISLEGALEVISGHGCKLMQIPDASLVEGKLWRELWPEEQRSRIDDALFEALTSGSAHFTAFCPTFEGEPRWWDVCLQAMSDPQGKVSGFLSVSRDVTSYVGDSEALHTVIAELRHRLKNSYALMSGLVRAMARGRPELSQFVAEVERGVGSLSAAQSRFVEGNETTDVRDLLDSVVQPLASIHSADIELAVNGLRCERRQADVIALACGELAVNAVKHGAFGHGGKVRIAASRQGENLVLHWDEQTPISMSAAAKSSGSGHPLIERMAKAGGGSFVTQWNADGLRSTLTLPY